MINDNNFLLFVPNSAKIYFMKGVFKINLEDVKIEEKKLLAIVLEIGICYISKLNMVVGFPGILKNEYDMTEREAQRVINILWRGDVIRPVNEKTYMINPNIFGLTTDKKTIKERGKIWSGLTRMKNLGKN